MSWQFILIEITWNYMKLYEMTEFQGTLNQPVYISYIKLLFKCNLEYIQ